MAAPALFARLYSEPWLISRTHLQGWVAAALAAMTGSAGASPHLAGAPQDWAETPIDQADPEYFTRMGGTAVISICGPILKNPDRWERVFGACDVDQVRIAAELAAMDQTVDRVILRVCSPGGIYPGVPECAAAIAALCLEKPVYAFCECACSAAYWLASQAQRIYMTPSGAVGSIGVYALYFDQSKWLDQIGVKINAISVGKMKLAGAYFQELTAEERAHFQDKCNRIGQEFHAAVLAGRYLEQEHMEGQVFQAGPAIEAGLVDGTAVDLSEVIELAR